MKIDAITLREIRMPLVHYFETSFGRTSERRIVLVTVHGDGHEGWGECTAGEGPFYNDEWTDGAWLAIRDFIAPRVLGKTLTHAKECAALFAPIRGHRMAKAAVENAVWHLEAEERKMPLWKLIGGKRHEIPCGVSIGIQETIDQLLAKIEAELAAGYQRIKVKVKPKWDTKVLRAIRVRWPDIRLSCDANSAYTTRDFAHLERFDDFNLLMIEQPLWEDDILHHAQLQKRLKTKLCLDESIHHARDAETALDAGACGIINIKLGRVGGFTEAIAVHDVCRSREVPVWCGGMLEAGIGRAHNIAMSTLEFFRLPGDVSASKRYWKEDIIEPAVEVTTQGTIKAPQTPGLGFAVKHDLIERLTVRKEVLRAVATSA